MKVGVLHLLVLVAHDVSCCYMLVSYLCYCVVLWYAHMHVGYVWEGLINAFLNVFLLVLLDFFEGILWELFWHYSPLDREAVAMYRGRA